MLLEEGQDFARERQRGLAEELAVEGVVVVIEHHPAQLQAAHPFPLVPAAFLELVRALLERRPAVGLAEHRAPEHDALRVIRAVVAEVELRAVFAERQQLVGIHAEERALQVEVAGGAEADVGQARVLPPVARPPAAIVGVLLRRAGRHGEERAVELDRIGAAPGAGGDEPLQVIHLADVGGLVAHRCARAVGHELAVHVEAAAARGGIGHGRDVRPLAGGQGVVLLQDGLAADEAQAVAGMGVEQEAVAAAGRDLVHEPRAAARQLLRLDPGFEREARPRSPTRGAGDCAPWLEGRHRRTAASAVRPALVARSERGRGAGDFGFRQRLR